MTRKELSKELVKLREKAGIERPEIYKKYKMSPNSIISLEAGERNFKLDVFFKYLAGIYMRLYLVSRDGDEAKNITIKQPGDLSKYIKKILKLQRIHQNKVKKAGVPKAVIDRLMEGDLSSGIDDLLSFLEATNYDVSFQVNEIMKERFEVAKEAEKKPMTEEEIEAYRKNIGKMLSDARIKNNLSIKEVAYKLNAFATDMYRFENGKKSFSINSLLNYVEGICCKLFLFSDGTKIEISNKESIGSVIKEKRKRKKMSCEELSQRINISRSSIMSIEHGKSNTPIRILIPILNYFNYTIVIE